MRYKVLNKNNFSLNSYEVIPIREKDMEDVRIWRNAQINVLRQKDIITKSDQQEYYEKKIKPLFKEDNPLQLLFSFLENTKLIGYGGLVNISWIDKRAEMSFLLDNNRAKDKRQYEKDMTNFIQIIKQLVFVELNFNRLFTETYSFREYHISILEKSGYKKEGVFREHIFYQNKYYDSILHSILKKEYYEK